MIRFVIPWQQTLYVHKNRTFLAIILNCRPATSLLRAAAWTPKLPADPGSVSCILTCTELVPPRWRRSRRFCWFSCSLKQMWNVVVGGEMKAELLAGHLTARVCFTSTPLQIFVLFFPLWPPDTGWEETPAPAGCWGHAVCFQTQLRSVSGNLSETGQRDADGAPASHGRQKHQRLARWRQREPKTCLKRLAVPQSHYFEGRPKALRLILSKFPFPFRAPDIIETSWISNSQACGNSTGKEKGLRALSSIYILTKPNKKQWHIHLAGEKKSLNRSALVCSKQNKQKTTASDGKTAKERLYDSGPVCWTSASQ